jgi:hypothetical protein
MDLVGGVHARAKSTFCFNSLSIFSPCVIKNLGTSLLIRKKNCRYIMYLKKKCLDLFFLRVGDALVILEVCSHLTTSFSILCFFENNYNQK